MIGEENTVLLKPGESMNTGKKKEVTNVEYDEKFGFLLKIKGIGNETLEDIKRLYLNKNDLLKALKEDKVPLRNDIVKKLKEALLK